jgi:hypothetical protein
MFLAWQTGRTSTRASATIVESTQTHPPRTAIIYHVRSHSAREVSITRNACTSSLKQTGLRRSVSLDAAWTRVGMLIFPAAIIVLISRRHAESQDWLQMSSRVWQRHKIFSSLSRQDFEIASHHTQVCKEGRGRCPAKSQMGMVCKRQRCLHGLR